MKTSQLPPGPTGLKFKNAMKMGTGAFDFLSENYARFGDIYTLHFPGLAPFVWFNRPDLVKKLFQLQPHEFDTSLLPIPIDIEEHINSCQVGGKWVDRH